MSSINKWGQTPFRYSRRRAQAGDLRRAVLFTEAARVDYGKAKLARLNVRPPVSGATVLQ